MNNDPENTPTKENYLLLFRNTEWYEELSPNEMQRVMADWMGWFDNLIAEGRCLGGHPLENEGCVVSGENRHVTDGPYAEAKESVGGYFMLQVGSREEAVEIAKMCPGLPYGATVEVRQVVDRCGGCEMAEKESAHQLAELAKTL